MNVYSLVLFLGAICASLNLSASRVPTTTRRMKQYMDYMLRGSKWNWKHKKTYAIVKTGMGYADIDVVSKYRLDGRTNTRPKLPPRPPRLPLGGRKTGTKRPKPTPKPGGGRRPETKKPKPTPKPVTTTPKLVSDVARGKKSYLSSTFAHFKAGLCNNGKLNDFCHTRLTTNPWYRIDLGTTYNIDEVIIYNRRDCCGKRFRNAVIQVGDSLSSLKTCGTFKGPGKTGQTIRIKCPGRMKGRWVQIQQKYRGYLHFADVQVSASKSISQPTKAAQAVVSDVARGKKSYLSSTFAHFKAGLCNNGKLNDFCHSRLTTNPWYRIDLGTTYNIDEVIIYNRRGCCGKRFRNAVVQVGDSLSSLKTCGTFKGPGKTGQTIRIKCPGRMKGRWVQIQQKYRGYLHFADVQVSASKSITQPIKAAQAVVSDVARGKKSYLSSTFAHFKAGLCNNGKLNDFCHSRLTTNPWYRIDLGTTYNIDEVIIYNRRDCCGKRFRNAVVQVGDSLSSLKTCGTFKGPGKTGQTIRIKCPGRMKGRWVQIQQKYRGYLHFADVQVSASKSISQPIKAAQAVVSDVARGKKSYLSSTFAHFKAGLCNNGKLNDFCHSRLTTNPWYRIDLGTTYNIDEVIIYNRRDCCGKRFRNAVVQIGDSLSSLKTCGTFKGPGKTGQTIRIKCPGRMKGRWVQIQQKYRGYLHFADVQVSASKSISQPTKAAQAVVSDVARGKKSYLSSTFAHFKAGLCNNGKLNDFCHTRLTTNPWYRIDLGTTYNIDEVIIYNRRDCCGNRFRDAVIQVGDSLASLKTCGTFKGPGKNGQIIRIKCPGGMRGRWVQIQQKNYRGYLNLAEVQVNGS
ncbi:uncharacterized protein LOC133194001 [Saccostrea echinata]|uniref:uncharacterized protein LOC133194001 n=1 Tax=Saccostrea echinata TaxID=191078 RepID=UPI002A7FF955|nr:uncharacterized protein LOC133194001 [Saccostrea echinata]